MGFEDDVSPEDEAALPGRRTDLKCGDCGSSMVLRSFSSYGPFYGCSKWPECRGRHGAHPDGSPKGIPANKRTRQARIQAHRVFDFVWKKHLTSKQGTFIQNRGSAYSWMRRVMGLTHSQAHIAKFTEAQCDELIRLIKHHFPQLRTRYDSILFDFVSASDETEQDQ